MKKILAVLLAVVIFAGMLASCGNDDPVVLFFAVQDSAGTFDPQIVSNPTSSIVVRNCFEGLLRKDENGNVVNGVAKDWSVSADGLTYTFTLRPDAVWHLTSNAQKQLEGKIPENFDLTVTADDFRFALMRAVDPATDAPLSYMLYNIKNAPEILAGTMNKEELGVRAIGRHQLEITLSQPQSNFPEVLTEPVCMPCNETFFNACSGRYGTLIAFALSNGPFYLSRFDETSYRINKASDYRGESVAVPDYVWLYVTKDTEALLEVLETADYSGAVINEDTYAQLKVKRSMTVTETPNILRSLVLNLRDDVLSQSEIRNAITCATDITLIAANENREPATCIVPLSAESSHTEGFTSFNEKEAAESLRQGLEALDRTSIDISILCEKRYEDTMRRLMQEWQRILGIYVNFSVKTATAAEIRSAVNNGNYQIAFCPRAAETDNIYEYYGSFISDSSINVQPELPPEEETTEEETTFSTVTDAIIDDNIFDDVYEDDYYAEEDAYEEPAAPDYGDTYEEPSDSYEIPDDVPEEIPDEVIPESPQETPESDNSGTENLSLGSSPLTASPLTASHLTASPLTSSSLTYSSPVRTVSLSNSAFLQTENEATLMELIAALYSGSDRDFEAACTEIENKITDYNVFIPVWYESSYLVCTKDVSGVIFFSGSDKLYFHKATNVK